MGEEGLGACVLDAGALIAIERGDARIRALLRTQLGRVIVTAPVLAEVWRGGSTQARLARVISSEDTAVEALDELGAKAVGVLLARSGTADIVDSSVVLAARAYRALVVTADASDLRRIDPNLALEEI